VRRAVPIGVRIEASYLLLIVANRADLLIVYSLAGAAAAGRYSLALALGQLVVTGPVAIVAATFPKLSALAGDELTDFAARLSRAAVLCASMVAVLVAVAAPAGIPPLLGEAYRGSIAPAAILVVAGVPAGIQWLFCRLAAVRDRAGLVVRSYLASVAVMVCGDLLLVPALGIVGAAVAALVGSTVGAFVVVRVSEVRGGLPVGVMLLPRRRDVAAVISGLRTLVRSGRMPSAASGPTGADPRGAPAPPPEGPEGEMGPLP
jgi:O-antigen/teichoic acid export membrane protein